MQLQKSLEQYQNIPKNPYICGGAAQRVGAGKILGVRMIFARILPNLPEKLHKKWPTKKSFFYVILGAVGCHFCSYFQTFAMIFRDFVKVFWDFAQISKDFFRIFTKPTVRSHPRLLHQWCNIKSECCDKC